MIVTEVVTVQETVKEFLKKYNINGSVESRYIDLISEIGELGKELLKGNDYGAKEYKNTMDIKMEIGDCLFSLLALCNQLDIEADKALNGALYKYVKRFDKKGDIGSGN